MPGDGGVCVLLAAGCGGGVGGKVAVGELGDGGNSGPTGETAGGEFSGDAVHRM
jgi:hypothetical protein